MNNLLDFLKKISEKLGIETCDKEKHNPNTYSMRIIYSAIGHVALASLFDLNDENEPISVTHFKRRIRTLISSYKEMYVSLKLKNNQDIEMSDEAFTEEVYELLLKTGHFYHYSKHLLPAKKCEAVSNGIVLLRGQAPGQPVYRSGLGAYSKDCLNVHSKMTIQEMFHLPDEPLDDLWNRIIRENEHKLESNRMDNLQYLEMSKFKNNYWKPHSDNGVFSLARTKDDNNRLYFLYHCTSGQTTYAQLPVWYYGQSNGLYDGENYRRLANACLKFNKCLPPIDYVVSNRLVKIELGYLMPPEELYLLMLYSWPCNFQELCLWKIEESDTVKFDRFHRCMVLDVFNALRPIYEQIGYTFTKKYA